MKRLAFPLAAATLALAVSTLYLAHELKLERARTAREPVVAQPTQQARNADAVPPIDHEVVPTPEAARTAASPQQPPQPPRGLAMDTAHLAELKTAFAPMMKDMMEYAGLNSYESERLLDLTAEAMVRGQELSRECTSTPGCDIRAVKTAAQESLERELERILGPDKLRRLNTYDELQRVKSFRSQLPVGLELSETAATQLGTALAEERHRPADKTESTSAFNRRMYDRAASVLTADQLAFFRQRQESAFGRE